MLGAGLDKVLDGLDLGYVRFDLAVAYTVAEVYTLMHGNWHLDILIVRQASARLIGVWAIWMRWSG